MSEKKEIDDVAFSWPTGSRYYLTLPVIRSYQSWCPQSSEKKASSQKVALPTSIIPSNLWMG